MSASRLLLTTLFVAVTGFSQKLDPAKWSLDLEPAAIPADIAAASAEPSLATPPGASEPTTEGSEASIRAQHLEIGERAPMAVELELEVGALELLA